MAENEQFSSFAAFDDSFLPLYTDSSSSKTPEDSIALKEHLEAAHRNIVFLQQEHAATIKDLHMEIQKLQDYIKDLQFQWHVQEVIVPNHDFFNCDLATLEEKVNSLIQDNEDLKMRLSECNKALEMLDQKQKFEQWQYQQELAKKDKTISHLQNELETKCVALAEFKSRSPCKKSRLLRLFSFNSESASSFVSNQSFPSLKCQTIEVDSGCSSVKAQSLPVNSSPCHSLNCDYSSYSSLSDKSTSEDDIFRGPLLRKQYTFPSPKYGPRRKWCRPNSEAIKLPSLPNREFVRQQIRVDKIASKPALDSVAIDHISSQELIEDRTN